MQPLIIDDYRVKSNDNINLNLSDLVIRYFITWGIDRDISPLVGIHNYLTKKNTIFFTDDIQVFMGDTPYSRLNELMRKFPKLFTGLEDLYLGLSAKEFDQVFENEIENIVENLYRFKNLHSIDLKFLDNIESLLLKELLSKTYLNYLKACEEDLLYRSFINNIKYLYFNDTTDGCFEFEWYFIILNLLSSHYSLDHESFVKDLESKFNALNLSVKQAKIVNWLIFKDTLSHIELSTYDGVIEIENLIFNGDLSHHFPFKLPENKSNYKLSRASLHGEHGCKVIDCTEYSFSNSSFLGTNIPYLKFSIVNESRIDIDFFFDSNNQTQPKMLKGLLFTNCSKVFSWISNTDISQLELRLMDISYDIPNEFNYDFGKSRSLSFKSNTLSYVNGPGETSLIKDIEYWGTKKCVKLGLLSKVVSLKDRFN